MSDRGGAGESLRAGRPHGLRFLVASLFGGSTDPERFCSAFFTDGSLTRFPNSSLARSAQSAAAA